MDDFKNTGMPPMPDQPVPTTPEQPTPQTGDLIDSPYDQAAAMRRLTDLVADIAADVELRPDEDRDGLRVGIMFDFAANIISAAMYHNDWDVIDAIMRKAGAQAVESEKRDAVLVAAAPEGRA